MIARCGKERGATKALVGKGHPRRKAAGARGLRPARQRRADRLPPAGGQLLAVSGQNTASPVVSKVMDFGGANGIEHIGDVLIIASATGCSLYRYDTATGTGAPITLTPSVPVCGDGVYFDSSRTTLYVTNGGGSYGGQVRQSSGSAGTTTRCRAHRASHQWPLGPRQTTRAPPLWTGDGAAKRRQLGERGGGCERALGADFAGARIERVERGDAGAGD